MSFVFRKKKNYILSNLPFYFQKKIHKVESVLSVVKKTIIILLRFPGSEPLRLTLHKHAADPGVCGKIINSIHIGS